MGGMDLAWLDKTLKERGITQREIAELLGYREGTVSKIINGKQVMKAWEADRIRRFLGYRLPEDYKPDGPERRVLNVLAELGPDAQNALVSAIELLAGQKAESPQPPVR